MRCSPVTVGRRLSGRRQRPSHRSCRARGPSAASGPARRLALAALIGLLVWLAAAPPAGTTGQPAGGAPPGPGAVDGQSLAAFFDALIPAQLARRRIPGATVAVVQDGTVAFARGYGWADVERQTPVVADRTLFHIGSNTKLFTATAVMQLVEQGKLDLGIDIATYLDFPIPATYPEPITLAHLLTHTAGFENRDIGMLAPSPEAVTPLRQWLPANLPARVRPPGQATGYSNYGIALAGYIVERASGLPYEAYVERHLLAPLQMQRSTIRQAVPPELTPEVARGYVTEAGRWRAVPLATYNAVPTGAIRATATDIGHFMLAHLQDGRYGDGRILSAATAGRMQQTLFRPDPRVNGLAHGFWELDRNGVRVLGHLGSAAPLHYSLLALLPAEGIGLFVAYNGDAARPLTLDGETLGAFLDHFYPAAAPALRGSPEAAARAGQVTGVYRRNTFGGSVTTVEKVRRLLGEGDRQISHPGDGTLLVTTLTGSVRFVEVAPDLFRRVDGQDALLVQRDERGQVRTAVMSSMPVYTYERLAWWELPVVNLALLAACVAVFASVPLVASVAWLVRRRRLGRPGTDGLSRGVRWLALAMVAIDLLFLVGLVMTLGDPATMMGDVARVRAVLVLPLLGTPLAGAVVAGAALAWRRRWWSLPARLHYTAVALAAVGFTWLLAAWNLLGVRV